MANSSLQNQTDSYSERIKLQPQAFIFITISILWLICHGERDKDSCLHCIYLPCVLDIFSQPLPDTLLPTTE